MPLDVTGIGAVAKLAGDLIDRVFPDKLAQAKERSEFLLKAQELDNQLQMGQIAINQAEAASDNLFVSGWRPFVGWVCGVAFLYHMIIQPLITYTLAVKGITFPMPIFDKELLSDTLYGLLGLGILRSTEKLGQAGHLPWQK